MMLNRYISMFSIFFTFLFLTSVFNESVAGVTLTKQHRDWNSFLLTNKGNAVPRMCTNDTNNYLISFCIDYNGNSYTPLLIITKDGKHKNDRDTKQYEIQVQARVDSNPIFYSTGMIDDYNGTRFIYLGNAFGTRFIQEAADGYYFRIKINMGGEDLPVIKYSLLGFTAAYNRVNTFLLPRASNDESYFRRSRTTKSDADYFD